MRLLVGFILLCCLLGVLLRRRDVKASAWIVCALALLLSAGYSFLPHL